MEKVVTLQCSMVMNINWKNGFPLPVPCCSRVDRNGTGWVDALRCMRLDACCTVQQWRYLDLVEAR